MISLKRYLDLNANLSREIEENQSRQPYSALLGTYRAGLVEIGNCAIEACPGTGPDLAHGISRILEAFGTRPSANDIASSEAAVRDLMRDWGKKTAQHYDRKAEEVKDLLLVMVRTAESLSHRDDRIARHLDEVTSRLESIASLDDLIRIRTSVENSARELKNSIAKMTAESKAVIDHLRVEVSACQAKLEKAEHLASLDSLTGLGSRRWVEGRIQQRIDSGSPFAILLVDIDGFSRVIDEYGNLVGDLLLKEFARELRSSCRFTDIVGRWGGDEFLVVLDHCGPEMETQVERLYTWISKPYHVPGRTGYVNVHLDVSLGLAEYRPEETLQELLERADAHLCSQRLPAKALRTA